jgi:hypothetical protein
LCAEGVRPTARATRRPVRSRVRPSSGARGLSWHAGSLLPTRWSPNASFDVTETPRRSNFGTLGRVLARREEVLDELGLGPLVICESAEQVRHQRRKLGPSTRVGGDQLDVRKSPEQARVVGFQIDHSWQEVGPCPRNRAVVGATFLRGKVGRKLPLERTEQPAWRKRCGKILPDLDRVTHLPEAFECRHVAFVRVEQDAEPSEQGRKSVFRAA